MDLLYRLVRTGSRESVVAKMKVPKTLSGPSFESMVSRRD